MEHLRKPANEMAYRLVRGARDIIVEERGDGAIDNVVLCPFSFLTGVAGVYYHAANEICRNKMEAKLGFQELFQGHGKKRDVLMAFREAMMQLSKDPLTKRRRVSVYPGGTEELEQKFRAPFHMYFLHKLLLHKALETSPEYLQDISKYLHVEHEFVDLNTGDPRRLLLDLERSLGEVDQTELDPEVPLEMVDADYTGLRAFVANAAFYTAHWQVPFDRNLTYWGSFYTETGALQQAKFMTLTYEFPYYEDMSKECCMLELPYYENSASLILVMPCDFNRHGDGSHYNNKLRHKSVDDMTRFLTVEDRRDFNMHKRMRTVQLALPKFFVQCTFGIHSLLKELGCQDTIKDDAGYEQLSGNNEPVRVGEGFHKAAIEVDEDGTFVDQKGSLKLTSPPDVYGGKTDGRDHPHQSHDYGPKQVSKSPSSKEKVHLVFDRPFLFDVRHNRSGLFVFSGYIACP
ncbi:heterochromatin-associated protein MENT-like [Paramacrobiotus metropolitanus]|uniref:heterochromatin-associated protein MENT-like n=1 Tax=Paramacrobiotus metropolitanus TaxID=2943436 RepID=UPI002445E4E8|nr:heterochromatin-associated protein MENT-like [Paramacrobiotus metropolitanus]